MRYGIQLHVTYRLIDFSNLLLRQCLENEEISQYYWDKAKIKGLITANEGF